MNKYLKRFTSFAIVSALSIGLIGCSEETTKKEEIEPKKAYTEAYQNMLEATSYEFNSNFNFDINYTGEAMTYEEEEALKIINDLTLGLDGAWDKELQKTELNLKLKFSFEEFNFDLAIPILVEEQSEKIYIGLDSIINNIPEPFLEMTPPTLDLSSIENSLVVLDFKDLDLELPTNVETNKETEVELIEQFVFSITNDIFSELNEDKFSYKDGSIVLSIDDETAKNILVEIFNSFAKLMEEEPFPQEQLNEILPFITVDKFESSLVVENEQISSEKGNFSFTITNPEAEEEQVSLGFDYNLNYNNINEQVNFTIDPETQEILNIEEVAMLFMTIALTMQNQQ